MRYIFQYAGICCIAVFHLMVAEKSVHVLSIKNDMDQSVRIRLITHTPQQAADNPNASDVRTQTHPVMAGGEHDIKIARSEVPVALLIQATQGAELQQQFKVKHIPAITSVQFGTIQTQELPSEVRESLRNMEPQNGLGLLQFDTTWFSEKKHMKKLPLTIRINRNAHVSAHFAKNRKVSMSAKHGCCK